MRILLLLLLETTVFIAGCATVPRRDAIPLASFEQAPAPTLPPSRLLALTRVKNPAVKPLKFSPEQQQLIRNSLVPGDVLLTYTAGVSSNLVVPGRFKHCIVFVGTAAERSSLESFRSGEVTIDDSSGDIIEARVEGVMLNRIADAMNTRVSRMVVLRPRLSHQDRQAYVSEVLSYRGQKYDFAMDFRDPSRKVCTEVVYWALQGRCSIDFRLTNRAGRPMLLSDDIAATHLQHSTPTSGFACVLFADEDPDQSQHARISLNREAEEQLRLFMRWRSS